MSVSSNKLEDLPNEIIEKILPSIGRSTSLQINKRLHNLMQKHKWKTITIDLSKIKLDDFNDILSVDKIKIICTHHVSKNEVDKKIKELKKLKYIKSIYFKLNLYNGFDSSKCKNSLDISKIENMSLGVYIIFKTILNNNFTNVYIESENVINEIYESKFIKFIIENYFENYKRFIYDGSKDFFIIYDNTLKLLFSSVGKNNLIMNTYNPLLLSKTNNVETFILYENRFPSINEFDSNKIEALKYFKYTFVGSFKTLINTKKYFNIFYDTENMDYEFNVIKKNNCELKITLDQFYGEMNLQNVFLYK